MNKGIIISVNDLKKSIDMEVIGLDSFNVLLILNAAFTRALAAMQEMNRLLIKPSVNSLPKIEVTENETKN
jgi:hypothetical protein